MEINDFIGDIKFVATQNLFYQLANELVVKKLDPTGVTCQIELVGEGELHQTNEWLAVPSWINMVVSPTFITDHLIPQTDGFSNFQENFISLSAMLNHKGDGQGKENESPFDNFHPITLIFVTDKGDKLRFLITQNNKQKITEAYLAALDVIKTIVRGKSSPTTAAINSVFKQPDNMVYLTFTESGWKVIDILGHESSKASETYLNRNDFRVKKPWIIFQKNNVHRYKIMDNNWVLNFDNLETLMLQPNDVSIYSNICQQNLQMASEFYGEHILPRQKYHDGSFPPIEQQREYFDYFQLIITSVIFAYTAVEAFVNICIPQGFEHVEEKEGSRTIYSKEGIERKFSLKDKLKKILPKILESPDPTKEKWWGKLVNLEDIRNEIIHTKEARSEERYSKLLSKNIFELIRAHGEIIRYYGRYIDRNKPHWLEKFPYNFGYNGVVPGLSDSEECKEWTVDVVRHRRLTKLKDKNDRII
ncbi:hypothetical protein [Pedobacter sp.]